MTQARERALPSVVATCYHLGVSTRRIDKLMASLGIPVLSKTQVWVMAAEQDEAVEQFRTRPLPDEGPFTFVTADVLVLKVRTGGPGGGARAGAGRKPIMPTSGSCRGCRGFPWEMAHC